MPGLAEAAAEAYLTGWALSEGPLTRRVEAGCAAAARCALDRPDDPGILEAALALGHLEGVQAEIAVRREELLTRHVKAVTAAWNGCLRDLDAADVVKRFRSAAYLHGESVTEDPQKRWWQDTGTQAALGWLYGIYRADGYDVLVSAIEGAIRDGMAEGEADALALAASRQGKTGFRIDAAFAAAHEKLAASTAVAGAAPDALARMITGAANDTGRRLAALAGDGAGADGMAGAVQDLTTGDDVRAVRTWTDWAAWAAIGASALALFQRVTGGLATLRTLQVDWETFGDTKVCPVCAGNAKNGPYPQDRVPDFPAHPVCRCDLQTRAKFPLPFLAPFLN